MMLSENTIQWKAAIGGLHYLFALVITKEVRHKITYKGGLTTQYLISSHTASTSMSIP